MEKLTAYKQGDKMEFEVSHTEATSASPGDIWHFWSHPETWQQWDVAIEWCKLKEGHSFVKGAHLILLPKGAPGPVNAVITECVENSCFKDEGETPLGKIILDHQILKGKGNYLVKHVMKFIPKNAATEEIFKNSMYKKMQVELPKAIKKLVLLSEALKVTNVT